MKQNDSSSASLSFHMAKRFRFHMAKRPIDVVNDDEAPLSALAPPVKKKTTAWQVVCEFRFDHSHCHTGPFQFSEEATILCAVTGLVSAALSC